MTERRASYRTPIQVAVSVTTDRRPESLGVTRDISDRGMLLHSMSRFNVGERVSLVYRAADIETATTGRVVRVAREPERWSTFPNVAAIELDVPSASR